MKRKDLNQLLKDLRNRGCYPSISYRGHMWRAHINGAGNYWSEGTTPLMAMRAAIKIWDIAGNPMDGYGSE